MNFVKALTSIQIMIKYIQKLINWHIVQKLTKSMQIHIRKVT